LVKGNAGMAESFEGMATVGAVDGAIVKGALALGTKQHGRVRDLGEQDAQMRYPDSNLSRPTGYWVENGRQHKNYTLVVS